MWFCPSTKYETKSINIAKYTNTRTHSHSRKEEAESRTRSEWRTNFISALCRLNSLTYSMSYYSTPPLLCPLTHAHTVSMIHIRATETLCHPGWSLKGHRGPRLIQRLQFVLYIYNLLQTLILWQAERRTEWSWSNTVSRAGLITWWGFGKNSPVQSLFGRRGVGMGSKLENVAPIFEVLIACWRPIFLIVISLSFFIITLLLSGELRAVRVTWRSTEEMNRNGQISSLETTGVNSTCEYFMVDNSDTI